MSVYEAEVKAMKEAARTAGYTCLQIRRDMLGTPNAMQKAGKEPVTIADYSSQAIIHWYLTEYFPSDRAISEERAEDFKQLASKEQIASVLNYVGKSLDRAVTIEHVAAYLDYGHDSQSNRVWTVDPIDGTKGFIRGDQFAVAIALLVDGVPTVSALACPAMPFDVNEDSPRGALAVAVRGEGAFLESLDGQEVRTLSVSDVTDPALMRVMESVESAHTDHDFSAQVVNQAGVRGEPVRIDSQAKYMAVADGRGEIYIRSVSREGYREKIWDHAAGVLVVQEAGGMITDLDGKPLDFSQGEKLFNNSGVLATSGPIHDQLVSAAAEIGGLR